MAESVSISVARDFSKFPAGRYKDNGPNSAEKLRDDILIPALQAGNIVFLDMDGVVGYPSSFLEETFGGLIRKGFKLFELNFLLKIQTKDQNLYEDIMLYMREETERSSESGSL